MKGSPYFYYKIPYEDWYIIVTNQGEHFYFNKSKEESYWQLHDVFETYQELSKKAFINSINFEDVSIMMAKSNGLKGLEDFYLVQEEQKQDDINTNNEDLQQTFERVESDAEGENIPKEYEDFSGNGVIALEGTNDQSAPGNGIGLISGYSSSSESVDDENQIIEETEDNSGFAMTDRAELDEAEVEDETIANNEGLDLLLSDDEDENKNKGEFFKLLDKYSSKILIYEPWFMVEEDLLSGFSKNPEYFAVTSSAQREAFFNQWCSTKQRDDDTGNSGTKTHPISTYPNAVQNYYRFLQNNKSQVKKLHYNEFKTRHQEFMETEFSDLASNEREDMYRQYRVMIIDYPEYEKQMKKSHPDANCKKLKLDSFLRENISSEFSRNISKKMLYEIVNSSQDDFHKWAELCNIYLVPRGIANSVNNFILGDEKRLASYIELFNEFIVRTI